MRSTWDLLNDPAARCDKLSKAAAKINKPKARGRKLVWDIAILHQFIMAPEERKEQELIHAVEDVVLVLRASSGWRSGDLAGLYDVGCEWVDADDIAKHGVRLRLWNTKMRKNAWSPPVFFPKLASRWGRLCVYRALKALLTATHGRQWQCARKTLPAPTDTAKMVAAKPLMVYEPSKAQRKKGNFKLDVLGESTIATYFKKAFLAQVQDADGFFAEKYTPHTARHAVASCLADMGTQPNIIAGLTLNAAETLAKTYITQVAREWPLPQACVDAQPLLPVKLLLPYVHYISTGGDATKPCGCRKVLQ